MARRSPSSTVSLVVGANSTIGGALAGHLRDLQLPVLASSRRAGEGDVQIDLTRPDDFAISPDLRVAYICAAVARIEDCARDPAGSRLVNVDGTLRLAQRLAEADVHVVYLSTNQVFAGDRAQIAEAAPHAPHTEYGRQKADTERQLRQLVPTAAIVRFGKVFGRDVPLFTQWLKLLGEGQPIEPFSDMRMAPIPLTCAVNALRLVGESRVSGPFQVCGERDLTYDEAAQRAVMLWHLDASLVRPVSARDTGRFAESIPDHTTLSVERLRQTFGLEPPSVAWTLDDALKSTTC